MRHRRRRSSSSPILEALVGWRVCNSTFAHLHTLIMPDFTGIYTKCMRHVVFAHINLKRCALSNTTQNGMHILKYAKHFSTRF